MKLCKKCNCIKFDADFCKDKYKKDGLTNWCKACKSNQSRDYRQTQAGKKHFSQYEASDAGKERSLKYVDNNCAKRKARDFINNGVKAGRIERQVCEVCGAKKTEAHHPDYAKPAKVMWLCTVHHGERHREYGVGISG